MIFDPVGDLFIPFDMRKLSSPVYQLYSNICVTNIFNNICLFLQEGWATTHNFRYNLSHYIGLYSYNKKGNQIININAEDEKSLNTFTDIYQRERFDVCYVGLGLAPFHICPIYTLFEYNYSILLDLVVN